jgi:hypothetical protein
MTLSVLKWELYNDHTKGHDQYAIEFWNTPIYNFIVSLSSYISSYVNKWKYIINFANFVRVQKSDVQYRP